MFKVIIENTFNKCIGRQNTNVFPRHRVVTMIFTFSGISKNATDPLNSFVDSGSTEQLKAIEAKSKNVFANIIFEISKSQKSSKKNARVEQSLRSV